MPDLVTPSWTRRPRQAPIRLILIHATRGANTMDKQYGGTINWFRDPPNLGAGAPGMAWGPTADALIGSKGEVSVHPQWRTTHSAWSAGFGAGGNEHAVDEHALSIELAQPAGLDSRGQYTSDPNAQYEPYTDACIQALADFVGPIAREFNIPLQHVTWFEQNVGAPIPTGFVGHDGTENGRKTGKSDPGKLFPWNTLFARIREQENIPAPPPPDPAAGLPVAPNVRTVGEIIPVVMHFGATPEQLKRMVDGYTRALDDARRWFQREVGASFTYGEPKTVQSFITPQLFAADAWGRALGRATEVGLPVWQPNKLVAILVDKIPHTTPQLGGASPDSQTGAVVKDGDALEIFARHFTGEPHDPKGYEQNVAMICHELLHAMHANDHEDISGPNIEHEWWDGFKADLAPVNLEKIRNSVWFTPVAAPPDPDPEPPTPPTPPAPPSGGTLTTEQQVVLLQSIRKASTLLLQDKGVPE